ncbi:MAG: hypothetical protein IKG84_03210 [Bacteroidales bacterium]|nr:hypothetical protein [Fibrobacter sp.]MBR3387227.1 hypothetical protein [Bacteroidales bacterium]
MAENNSYKLLIVAYNIGLIHIRAFTKYLKKENPSVDIHLLTDREMDSVTDQMSQFVSKIIRIRAYRGRFSNTKIAQRINKVIFRFSFAFLSFKKYDIINIHFAKPVLLKIMPWLANSSKSIVITPWGSDVLRLEGENAIKRMQLIYNYASCVTCDPSSQLGMTVIEKFKYDPKMMCPLRFGLDYVDFIEEVAPDKTVDDSKSRFDLTGRYVITCGYSTSPSHRHEAIIDAVNSIRNELPDNLTLLFPFTYGWGSEQYVQSIKDKCCSLNLDAVFVEEYLSLEDLYSLRMATDIFVHVQISDAGAACVMQYILCHKKIVHGSWMKYVDLEQYKPLFYFPVDRMEELGTVILEAYHSEGIDIPDGVITTIMGRGWNKEIKKWDELFCSMVN